MKKQRKRFVNIENTRFEIEIIVITIFIFQDWPSIAPAEMWTRKGVEEFKETIRREAGDAVIKIGHGETVTVRVPTHEDGTCLFWEFATDGYDIGFGVYFEWSKPESNQVSVHINESEDEEDDEDDYDTKDDLESGQNEESMTINKQSTPSMSIIIPVSFYKIKFLHTYVKPKVLTGLNTVLYCNNENYKSPQFC